MKKFEEVLNVDDYEVLTDIGFVPIKNVMKTIEYDVYEIYLNNDLYLYCADNHILIDEFDNEIYAKDSLFQNIKTSQGISHVLSVQKLSYSENMYDLELEYHHKYFTNDILSHNTTVVAAYLLHLALFNKDYNIAILANKKAQAAETLDRIKTMYISLPWWLQMGVRRWNVQDILLDLGVKGTSVFTESTAGSSIRGKSVNCLTGNTIVTLEHKETKEVFEFSLESLYEKLNEIQSSESN